MRKARLLRILIVDDEPVIANTLAEIFRREGFESRAVYSGEDAIAVAEMFLPHALISDVIMSGKNGIRAAIEIRDKIPFCRILLFSADAILADVLLEHSGLSKAFEILGKPVHPTELLAKLRSMLGNMETEEVHE